MPLHRDYAAETDKRDCKLPEIVRQSACRSLIREQKPLPARSRQVSTSLPCMPCRLDLAPSTTATRRRWRIRHTICHGLPQALSSNCVSRKRQPSPACKLQPAARLAADGTALSTYVSLKQLGSIGGSPEAAEVIGLDSVCQAEAIICCLRVDLSQLALPGSKAWRLGGVSLLTTVQCAVPRYRTTGYCRLHTYSN